jgi:hypothetical protein
MACLSDWGLSQAGKMLPENVILRTDKTSLSDLLHFELRQEQGRRWAN